MYEDVQIALAVDGDRSAVADLDRGGGQDMVFVVEPSEFSELMDEVSHKADEPDFALQSDYSNDVYAAVGGLSRSSQALAPDSPDECHAAEREAYAEDIRGEFGGAVEDGDVFCLTTTAGNLARLSVVHMHEHAYQIDVSVTLWARG